MASRLKFDHANSYGGIEPTIAGFHGYIRASHGKYLGTCLENGAVNGNHAIDITYIPHNGGPTERVVTGMKWRLAYPIVRQHHAREEAS